jgi:2-polyprenyl-6-methoxyphenol hydroxylase-like FAD-dependent oxidoreductase
MASHGGIMNNRTVLISGGGIAGFSLAHWLRRHGFAPTIVERAPAQRTGGQAIDVRGAARTVVERMGVMDAIRASHTGAHGLAYVDRGGRPIARLGGDDFGDSGGIVAEIEILRGDLVRILEGAAGDVETIYDDVVTGLRDDEDGATVTFRDRPPRRFDIVVGADGLRSGVRRLTFGAESSYVNDLGYYSSYFAARTTLDLNGWELMYNLPAGNGVGGRVVLLYPVGRTGEVRAMFCFMSPDLSYDRRDTGAQKALLAKAFSGAGWEIPGLISQMWATDDLYFARNAEIKLDRWSSGRCVLLGDSAFAGSLGMGTSMALVGAYVLAGELAAANGDHRLAFGRYEDRMRDYVRINQKRPPGSNRGFAPKTETGIRLRNQMMRLMVRLPGKQAMMGGIQKSANAIDLPEYLISVRHGA